MNKRLAIIYFLTFFILFALFSWTYSLSVVLMNGVVFLIGSLIGYSFVLLFQKKKIFFKVLSVLLFVLLLASMFISLFFTTFSFHYIAPCDILVGEQLFTSEIAVFCYDDQMPWYYIEVTDESARSQVLDDLCFDDETRIEYSKICESYLYN